MHNPEKPLHTPLLLGYTAPCFRQTGGVSFRVGGLTLSRSPAASNKKLPCVMCLWPWDKQRVSTRHKTLQSWFPRKSLLWVTKKSLHTVLIYLKMSNIYSLDFSIKYQVRLCFQHEETLQNYLSSFKVHLSLGYAFNNTQNTEYFKPFQLVKSYFAFSQVFAVTNAEVTDFREDLFTLFWLFSWKQNLSKPVTR